MKMWFNNDRCNFDFVNERYNNFPKSSTIKTENDSQEIPSWRCHLLNHINHCKHMDESDKEFMHEIIQNIPKVTFTDVLSKQIHCGPRQITDEILEKSHMNTIFCIKPILAVLYILPPKSVESINPHFIKEILSIGNRKLPLLKLISNLIGSCSAYFEYQVEMEIGGTELKIPTFRSTYFDVQVIDNKTLWEPR